MDVNAFSDLIKKKYPDYKDVPADELTQRVLAKFPEYKGQVTLSSNALPPIGQDLLKNQTTQVQQDTSLGGLGHAAYLKASGIEIPQEQEQALGGIVQGAALGNLPLGQMWKAAKEVPTILRPGAVRGATAVELSPKGLAVRQAPGFAMEAEVVQSPLELELVSTLKQNLPAKQAAMAKMAEVDPIGALKTGLPIKQWQVFDKWLEETKSALGTGVEATAMVEAKAKNLIDQITGVLPTLQSRPGFIGPKPDNVPADNGLADLNARLDAPAVQPSRPIDNTPMTTAVETERLAQVQQALPTAPAVPMQDWQVDTSIPGRTIYSNASGYKVEVPPGVEPSLFLKTIREVEKAQGEKSVIGEVPALPTNTSPTETLPTTQPRPVHAPIVVKQGTTIYRGSKGGDLSKTPTPGVFTTGEKTWAEEFAKEKGAQLYEYTPNKDLQLLNSEDTIMQGALIPFFKNNPSALKKQLRVDYHLGKVSDADLVQEALFDPTPELAKYIQSMGYDGFVNGDEQFIFDKGALTQKGEPTKVLSPAQEKAKFNKEMKKTPNVQPWAANKVLEVLNDPKTPSTMPKEGFLNVLKNKQVKPDQLEWDGLNDFLKGKEKITKKEVQKFVEENGLNLIEIDKNTPSVPKYVYSVVDADGEPVQDGFYDSSLEASEDIHSNVFGNIKGLKVKKVPTGETELGVDSTSYGHMKDLQLPGGNNYREKRFQLPFKEYTIEEKASPWSSNDFHGLRGNPRRGDRLGGYFEGSIEDGWIYRNPRGGIEHIAPKGVNAGEADRILFAKHPEIEKSAPNISITREDEQFTSGAYPEPGIVAETRYTDRTIGKDKVLFLEEVQSHMHQAGRAQGYEQPLTKIGVQKVESITDKNLLENVYKEGGFKVTFENGDEQFIGGKVSEAEAIKRAREALMRDMPILGHKGSPIPNAPFKAGKHVELVMKRMVRQAVEEGKDGIAWTTGQMQKDRYNLAKQVSKIETGKVGDKYRVETFLPNGDPSISRDLTEEELPGFIGKDMATKIVEGHKVNKHTFEGLDLQIGGKWADNLYDQQMVNFANKFFGKWGAKVAPTKMTVKATKLPKGDYLDLESDIEAILTGSDTFEEAKSTLSKYGYNLSEDTFEDMINRDTARASTARQWAKSIEKEIGEAHEAPVPYLKFTPELKRAALKQGFPLFSVIGAAGLGAKGVSEAKHK